MRRRLLAALLALPLVACGDEAARAPFAESRVPPSLSPRFYPPQGWTWGFVKVGDGPVQRYGVSGPAGAPRAQVLILPGYSETAEKWFETARDLNRLGYTVWVLERQGQGGGERQGVRRDLGHAATFDPDIAAVQAMVRAVIRPPPQTPTVVVGHALGGLIAVRALEGGLPVDGAVLSSPTFDLATPPWPRDRTEAVAGWARRLGLGWIRTPGQAGWRRDAADDVAAKATHDPSRASVQQAWMTANPDLRMGGPSLGWFAAFYDTARAGQAGLGRVEVPIRMLGAQQDVFALAGAQTTACRALPHCEEIRFSGAWHDLNMEADPVRAAWLSAIDGFIKERAAAKARPPASSHGL